MKRTLILTLAGCFSVLSLSALAAEKTMDTKMGSTTTTATEPGHDMTCGQMMEKKSVNPQKMGEMITSMAEALESHAKWVQTSKDKNAKKEADELNKIAKTHREIATNLTKLSNQMRSLKDLPGAEHDMKTMDPKMTEIGTKVVAQEREVAAMLTREAEEGEKMMKTMKGQGGSGY